MTRRSPPYWMDRILQWYCAEHYIEEVQGDLHEWYSQSARQGSIKITNLRYLLAVFQYFSIFRLKPFQKLIDHPKYLSMKNIVTLTFRNFKKNKLAGFVRLINLILGIGIFLLALIYTDYELSYDDFHEKSDNIYRAGISFESNPWAASPMGLGIYALENSTDVKQMTRFMRVWDTSIEYGDRQFYERGGFMADSTLFNLFSYRLISGNPETAMKDKMSIVLTESLAKKYFGDEDPMGKSLTLSMDLDRESGEQGTRIVTGVMADIPEQSHLRFDFVCPSHTMKDTFLREWRNFWVYTFVEIDSKQGKTNAAQIIKDQFVSLNDYDEETAKKIEIVFTPIKKIHLYANHEKEYADNGNIFYVYILFSIGLFILIVSSINFINLTIIHGLDRAKEVGLRKTVGASRFQLVLQFMAENMLLLVIAGVVCLLLLAFFELPFRYFSGLTLPLNALDNPNLFIALGGLLFALQLVSGIYPALILSKFKPAEIVKSGGQSIPMKRVGLTRKVLIIMQFSISLILVIGSFIVYSQLNFIQNKDLGFEKDQVLLIPLNPWIGDAFETLENQLLSVPGIQSISTSSSVPGYRIMMQGTMELGAVDDFHTRLLGANEQFLDTYDIDLVAGRQFIKDLSDSEVEFILNETAAKQMFDTRDPINKSIITAGDTGRVVGVVKDFNFKSLHSDIDPLTIRNLSSATFGYASVKFDAVSVSSVTTAIDQASLDLFPHLPPLSYEFLDDRFSQMYQAETKLKSIVWVFCLITMMLTASGILGIAMYSAKKRAKEIAIRKVLGGNLVEMITILSKSFIYLLLIALVVGLPGAFYLSDWWLQDFAYRIAIEPGVFVVSALVMATLITLSFGFMTFKTASTNPAQVLKSE